MANVTMQYYYVEYAEELMTSDFFKTDYYEIPTQALDQYVRDEEESALYDKPDVDELDLSTYDVPYLPASGSMLEQSPLSAILWRGVYTGSPNPVRFGFGVSSIEPPLPCASVVQGQGFDATGDFTIQGSYQDAMVRFNKIFAVQEKRSSKWRYEGTFNPAMDEITGQYAHGDKLEDVFDRSLVNNENALGHFDILYRPAYYFRSRSLVDVTSTNRPRYLWRLALNSVLHAVRVHARHVPWEFFEERRNARYRFLDLYSRLDELAGNWGSFHALLPLTSADIEELGSLQNASTTADLRFYRSLARCLARREVIHLCVMFALGRAACSFNHYSECCCNACGRDGFRTSRYVCVECSPDKSDTFDLCSDCIDVNFPVSEDENNHTNSHALLQIRSSVRSRRIHNFIDRAKEALKQVLEDTEGNMFH